MYSGDDVTVHRPLRRVAGTRSFRLGLLVGGAAVWWLLAGAGEAHADRPAHDGATATTKPASATHGDLVSGLAKSVDKTVGGVTKTVDNTVHATTKTVDSTVHATTKTVDSTVHATTKTVDTTVHATTKTVERTTTAVTEAVATTTHRLTETVDRVTHTVTGTLGRAVDTVGTVVTSPHTRPRERGARPVARPQPPSQLTSTAPAPAVHPHRTTGTGANHTTTRHSETIIATPRITMPTSDPTSATPMRASRTHSTTMSAGRGSVTPGRSPAGPPAAPYSGAGPAAGSGSVQNQHDPVPGYAGASRTHSPTLVVSSRRDETWALLSRADLVTVRPG